MNKRNAGTGALFDFEDSPFWSTLLGCLVYYLRYALLTTRILGTLVIHNAKIAIFVEVMITETA